SQFTELLYLNHSTKYFLSSLNLHTFFRMIRDLKNRLTKFFAELTLFSLEVFVLLAVFIVALVAFIFIARMVFEGNTHQFDEKVFSLISAYVSNINTSIMRFITILGTHLFLIPANLALTAWFLFIKKRRWNSIKIPAVALSSLLLMFFLKLIFHRERPLIPLLEAAKGFSFPSGHALMSVTFYGLLIVIAWENIKSTWLRWSLSIGLALLIIVIGLSRVYLRVHYASDVVAGFCVGIVWLLLSVSILSKLEKYGRRKIELAPESVDNVS
ncbi:MAG: phosphatase PAP2 family protein, partial [Ginsengibacter sp.]